MERLKGIEPSFSKSSNKSLITRHLCSVFACVISSELLPQNGSIQGSADSGALGGNIKKPPQFEATPAD